jgi:hypothetical protein
MQDLGYRYADPEPTSSSLFLRPPSPNPPCSKSPSPLRSRLAVWALAPTLQTSHRQLSAELYTYRLSSHVTYDHRTMNTELPVRSAVLKHCTGGLVVRWVTTSESPLLYVFALEAMFLLIFCMTEEYKKTRSLGLVCCIFMHSVRV